LSFIDNNHGAWRYQQIHPAIISMIEYIIWVICIRKPSTFKIEYVIRLGIELNIDFIRRVFKKWGFSKKVITELQLQKFTAENIRYYSLFSIHIKTWNWFILTIDGNRKFAYLKGENVQEN
jgi:hypothetical protein